MYLHLSLGICFVLELQIAKNYLLFFPELTEKWWCKYFLGYKCIADIIQKSFKNKKRCSTAFDNVWHRGLSKSSIPSHTTLFIHLCLFAIYEVSIPFNSSSPSLSSSQAFSTLIRFSLRLSVASLYHYLLGITYFLLKWYLSDKIFVR